MHLVELRASRSLSENLWRADGHDLLSVHGVQWISLRIVATLQAVTVITTGFKRNVVPSSSLMSVQRSLDSKTATSVSSTSPMPGIFTLIFWPGMASPSLAPQSYQVTIWYVGRTPQVPEIYACFAFAHRATTALRALSVRSAGLILVALTVPPFLPPI